MTTMTTDRQLILMRHAKSDWHAGASDDFSRPLNARGVRDAANAGRYLATTPRPPTRIIASTATRALATAQSVHAVLREAGESLDEIIALDSLYHAGDARILAVAREHLASSSCVLLVAHNPGMAAAVRACCPQATPFADGKLMPTCAIARIDFDARLHPLGLCALTRPSEWGD